MFRIFASTPRSTRGGDGGKGAAGGDNAHNNHLTQKMYRNRQAYSQYNSLAMIMSGKESKYICVWVCMYVSMCVLNLWRRGDLPSGMPDRI